MPRYSTSTSIYIALPGLSNNEQTKRIIEYHSDRVSGLINSYVGVRYNVSGWTTTASTPQVILSISDRVTSMYTMRSVYTKDAQNANEWVEELGEQALEELKSIADGSISVIDDAGAEAPRASVGNYVIGNMANFTPVFDMDKETAWGVDKDLLDDIERDRT